MLLELFEEIRNKCGLKLKKLEYGPGFAVPYFEDDDFEDTDEDIFVDEDKQEAATEKEALQPSEDGEADDKLDIEEVE